MCTALKFRNCVGRNFDYEISYNEEIVKISPNRYGNEYAIIGVGSGIVKDYPLLYDGMNSEGLVCCGLAFPHNAHYFTYQEDKSNIPAFDFTFQILSNCDSVGAVKKYLENVNIWCEPYSMNIQNSELHWFISDKNESIVVEQTKEGLEVYTAETNVLTNNPPYPIQLSNYKEKSVNIGDEVLLPEWYTRGLSTMGLRGDYTSDGRFERASYLLRHLEYESAGAGFDNSNQTFHLLSSVEQVYGLTPVNDKFEYTLYSIVYDMVSLGAYIKTYDYMDSRMILFDFEDARYGLYGLDYNKALHQKIND